MGRRRLRRHQHDRHGDLHGAGLCAGVDRQRVGGPGHLGARGRARAVRRALLCRALDAHAGGGGRVPVPHAHLWSGLGIRQRLDLLLRRVFRGDCRFVAGGNGLCRLALWVGWEPTAGRGLGNFAERGARRSPDPHARGLSQFWGAAEWPAPDSARRNRRWIDRPVAGRRLPDGKRVLGRGDGRGDTDGRLVGRPDPGQLCL